ncbi:FAD binding domain-containing protein [Roseobacter sp. EG26]|uniref:FAD binding domain-containing protein n=1 Tax=Roseobacter sp. EG26 TaxID=3412477 RepID=UPI003CE4CC34
MSHPAKYLRPPDLQQAIQALADEDLTIAAGCTDLFPATDRKSLQGPVLDITAIPTLRGIRQDGEGIHIGATTTWHDIATADLPPSLFGLQLAAREVGALQIQNRGTIAGNLCNASPAADGVPPLLTLDAEVGLCSIRGRRQIPLGQFITGPRQTERHHDELVTHIFIPKSALQGAGSFVKLGARKYLVISIVMVATRIQVADDLILSAAISVGSCGPVATRLPALEAHLTGCRVSDATIPPALVAETLHPIDDIRATAAYRIDAATVLLQRMVGDLRAPSGLVA